MTASLYDLIIIGTGAERAILAIPLTASRKRILILETGSWLSHEKC